MKKDENTSNLFFVILFVIFMFSVFVMYNNFILKGDFNYFLNENDLPSVFDLNTYPD